MCGKEGLLEHSAKGGTVDVLHQRPLLERSAII